MHLNTLGDWIALGSAAGQESFQIYRVSGGHTPHALHSCLYLRYVTDGGRCAWDCLHTGAASVTKDTPSWTPK